jgi:septal ring factor EnvC (AmiA/AmiB activator)
MRIFRIKDLAFLASWRLISLVARLALLAPVAVASAAADNAATAKQLEDLRTRLSALQDELNETRGRREAAREEVRELERRIGRLLAESRTTAARQKSLAANLEQLRREAGARERERAEQANRIAAELRAAYAFAREDRLKLALNQNDPARLARLLTYHRYVQAARVERIRAAETRLERIAQLEAEIRDRSRELAELRAAQSERRTSLEQARGGRARLLASLNREVGDRAREIERLKLDRARLERLLAELRPMLPAMPPPEKGARFSALEGRLRLPVRGHIEARFNQPKNAGELRWRGVFLAAREGEEVHAVARGRVVYADWLRGFGLLLILDHGDGYMTLYGHNQGLYRHVGDWVEAGEVLGLVGSTGDAPQPGLYFELRHHGEPRDPLRWCVARSP